MPQNPEDNHSSSALPDNRLSQEYQSSNITIPVKLSQSVTLGNIVAEYCGDPEVEYKDDDSENTGELILTLRISLKIPVIFNSETNITDIDDNGNDRSPG